MIPARIFPTREAALEAAAALTAGYVGGSDDKGWVAMQPSIHTGCVRYLQEDGSLLIPFSCCIKISGKKFAEGVKRCKAKGGVYEPETKLWIVASFLSELHTPEEWGWTIVEGTPYVRPEPGPATNSSRRTSTKAIHERL